ncbi:MAG: PilW family protein [Oleiphilus sp.]
MMTQRMMIKQKGLSMVELIVAMALSLILMLGVIQIFISNKKTFEINHDLSLMQESGRVALDLMTGGIRMADHWVGVEAESVQFGTTSLSTAPSGCGASQVFDTEYVLRGYEGASSLNSVANFPSNCIPASDYVPDTDIIFVKYADGRTLTNDTGIADAANNTTYYVRALEGQSAYVFKGSDSATAIAQIPAEEAVFNMEYGTELFFLRKCSVKVADDCKDELPTLVRLALTGDKFEQEALIEGVEQLQLEYGIDNDDDYAIDEYQPASAIANTPEAWADVLSVKISLISRSTDQDFSLDEQGKEYLMAGDKSVSGSGYVVGEDDKHFRRKLYQREVFVRNRGRL